MENLPTELFIAPDHGGNAIGTWVIDDGLSLNIIEGKKYRHLEFKFRTKSDIIDVSTLNSCNGLSTKLEEVHKITIFYTMSLRSRSMIKSIESLCYW